MKKFAIGFILGAIIFSSITAYAIKTYSADQIQYSQTYTVKDKLDSLYSTQNNVVNNLEYQYNTCQNSLTTYENKFTNLCSSDIKYGYYKAATRAVDNTVSVSLSSGNYVCVYNVSVVSGRNSNETDNEHTEYLDYTINGCTSSQKLKGYHDKFTATNEAITESGYRDLLLERSLVFKCQKSSSGNVSITYSSTQNARSPILASLYCIKM